MNAKRQRMVFIGCFLAYASAYIGRLNLSAALAGLIRDFSITAQQGGLFQTVFALVYASGQIINGAFADKISPRKHITIGLIGSALCNLVFSYSSNFAFMVFAWGLNGVFQSMLWTPIVRLISIWFTGEERKNVSFGLNITLIIGHLIAWGLSGFLSGLFSWRLSFRIPAAVVLAGAACAWLLIPSGEPSAEVRPAKEIKAKAMPAGTMVFSTGLWLLLLCCVANGFVRDSIMAWAPSILASSGLGVESTVIASLIIPVINMLGMVVVNRLYRGMRERCRFAAGVFMVASAAISVLLAVAWGAPLFVLALLLGSCVAVLSGMNPMLTTLAPMQYDRAGRVGLVAGLSDGFIYLGSSLSGVMTGALSDAAGWQAVFVVWAAVAVVGGLLALLSERGSAALEGGA